MIILQDVLGKGLGRWKYLRLLETAESSPRLKMIMETICSTGIRVSELRYFTVEAVRAGEIEVSCKNKTRTIIIPSKLRKKLREYIAKQKIKTGPVFITKSGRSTGETSGRR